MGSKVTRDCKVQRNSIESINKYRFSQVQLHDWEIEEMDAFFKRLYDISIMGDSDDSMVWLGDKNDSFSVKSFYAFLAGKRAEPFPHSIVWSSWAPVRVSIFAWEASWARILTLDQLKKRGWKIPNRCYMCKEEEETCDHLLLHCTFARVVWHLVFSLFGVQWVMHSSTKGFLLSWGGAFVGKKRKKAWKIVPLCVFWTLWRERNRRAFENCESTNQAIKNSFLFLFWDWVKLYIADGPMSVAGFVDWLGSR